MQLGPRNARNLRYAPLSVLEEANVEAKKTY
jgi:hypothetical protein